MTIEQVKEEAKKRLDHEITDEQAQAWLNAHPAGELSDEELENVAGGSCFIPTDDETMMSKVGKCWKCGGKKCKEFTTASSGPYLFRFYKCKKCGATIGGYTASTIPFSYFDHNGNLLSGSGPAWGGPMP